MLKGLTVERNKVFHPSTARPRHCRCGRALSNKSRKTQSSSEAWKNPVKRHAGEKANEKTIGNMLQLKAGKRI